MNAPGFAGGWLLASGQLLTNPHVQAAGLHGPGKCGLRPKPSEEPAWKTGETGTAKVLEGLF